MRIPFVDLSAQYKEIKTEIDIAVARIIDSSKFIGGEDVGKFEEEFARYIGNAYCIGVNSGTDALILGVRALGLGQGDEIIIPANTYMSGALAASENGAKPVFVDIDEEDFGINLKNLTNKINNRTRAVIITHLNGQPDKIDEVKNILKKFGRKIYLIEDACQAHGAFYKNKRVGSFGIFSAFSFYPGKNLGAYGDAGAIATNDKMLAGKYKLLREYGQIKKYHHDSIGVNSRLDSIQAAVLRIKLPHLDKWNNERRKIALKYSSYLNEHFSFIKTPDNFNNRESIYHLYVIRIANRNKLLNYLEKNGIQVLIHYPVPLHLQKAYRYLGYSEGDLPIVEKVSSEILSLPIYPELNKEKLDYILEKITKFYK